MAYAIEHQVTGPGETNTYLLYEVESGEAALFDVGGPIDPLADVISQRSLHLRYIFTTHGHVDHVWGLPLLRERYPDARWCLAREEFEDLELYEHWEQGPPDLVARERAAMEQGGPIAEMLRFQFGRLGAPDIYLEDGQVYHLGGVAIHTMLCAGHSRGGICFRVGDILFAGDVLFHRSAGRADLPRSGGPEARRASILRLYTSLPDDTRVYPGHGPITDIGTEKTENRIVRESC